MMDSNGTYEFKMTNIYGTPSMMVNVGPMNSVIDIGNDGSYQYARISLDVNETLTIPLNPPMRKIVSSQCTNGSYALKGGFDSCTIYIGLQCASLCAYNFSVNLIATTNNASLNINEPLLLIEGQSINGKVNKGVANYFFLPFTKNVTNNMVLALDKTNNDTYLVARIITNAYLPYQKWSYPNRTLYDFISESFIGTNEVMEITLTTLQTRCLAPSSCALLVGVVGGSIASTYSLKLLENRYRLQSN